MREWLVVVWVCVGGWLGVRVHVFESASSCVPCAILPTEPFPTTSFSQNLAALTHPVRVGSRIVSFAEQVPLLGAVSRWRGCTTPLGGRQ